MMVNLFSMFDPQSSLLSLNWLALVIPLSSMSTPFWVMKSRWSWLQSTMYNMIHHVFLNITKTHINPGCTLLLTMLFLYLMQLNYYSLYPFVFSTTGHFMIAIILAFPIWTALLLLSLYFHPLYFMAHLIPQGTPPLLMFFMVVIETISIIIRPLTLAVRLTANMVAGHLLIALLSNLYHSANNTTTCLVTLFHLVLMSLETAVAIIQAYVFTLLISLYLTEIS